MIVNGGNGYLFGELDFGGKQGGGKPGELLGGVGSGETDVGFYLWSVSDEFCVFYLRLSELH